MRPREKSESSRSDGGIECWSVKCHPACGIMAWFMRPTSWIGSLEGSSCALGLKLSLTKHWCSYYPSGLTLNSTIGCGITTRRRSRSMAAGVALHDGLVSHTESGATYVTSGCSSSLAKSRCDTSFECLASPLMVRPMYCVMITVSWRTRRYLNKCLGRSIMQLIDMGYVRLLPQKSYVWVKKTAWPIWQICS